MAYESVAQDCLLFRPVAAEDLPFVNKIEEAGFPPDEMASPSTMKYRQENASEFFLVATAGEEIVGYTCGTLTAQDHLDHDTMFTHDPQGGCLCVHSICVAPTHRRKGLGLKIATTYVRYIAASQPQVHTIRLICKQELVHFYKQAGLEVVGPSDVVWGKEPWIEMKKSM